MRYLPAQVKEMLALKEQTLRHWRKVLIPLQEYRGYGPCFSPGDLLALKVVAFLHSLGVQVGTLTACSVDLFKICGHTAWFGLEGKVLTFNGAEFGLLTTDEWHRRGPTAAVSIPMTPLIAQLRQCLSDEGQEQVQPQIKFPPLDVGRGAS